MSAIEAQNLTKRFGDATAVDDLSFEVGSGEIVGLLGANGAGKTTIMKMLLGLLRPTSGVALITGETVDRVDRRAMGYVPQGLGLYRELTVSENVRFIAAGFGVSPPDLAESGLEDVADRRVGELSLGLRRRVAFVAASCHDPEVLILDEPTSGVGPLGRARLWETIHGVAESGTAVLISTHYMDEAEECDRVVLMAHGRQVVTGTVGSIIGRLSAVEVTGEVSEEEIAALSDRGGTVLIDTHGWRVVGLDLDSVAAELGPSARASTVPATFEEAFVALSG